MNILNLLINLSDMTDFKVNTLYKGSNRINNVGDGLEEYLKEAIAGTFDFADVKKAVDGKVQKEKVEEILLMIEVRVDFNL